MRTIIIDVTRVVRRLLKGKMLTGIDRVALAYIHHYQSRARALMRWSGKSWILPYRESTALFQWIAAPRSKMTLKLILARGIFSPSSLKAEKGSFLINTGHIGLGQNDYSRMVKKLNLRPIFFVHDLIAIAYPEFCDPGEDLRHKEKMNSILQLAHGVITNSAATLQDFNHYAKAQGQVMPPSRVALLASGIPSGTVSKRPIEKPYFVILSTIEPRKNHLLLLQIWRNLSQKFGKETPHLFVIGQRGWESENVIDLLERCQFLKGYVTEISHCPDAELLNYIHHSQALLTPSFIEGYNLPLIEALDLGVPVIANDLPVFRELAGEVPDYVHALDGKRWEELILDYAKADSPSRKAQILRIKEFKKPTWDNHFVQVDRFLEELI